jgi:hypothetical protein
VGVKLFKAAKGRAICLAVSVCIGAAARQGFAREGSGGSLRLTAVEWSDEKPPDRSVDKPWHFEFGFRDGHTKLAETKRLLEKRLKRPLKLDVLDFFDPPETPLDRKSEFLLTTFYLGAGRRESDWLIWTIYVGGGMGRNHDHQRVGTVNLEVSFKYAYVYTGASAEIYPWSAPKRENLNTWSDSFSASRPFLATGFETGYVSAEGRGHWKIAPLPRLYQDKVRVQDWITSLNLGLGWNLPVNRCWSIVLTGDYRFHFYRPDEFNGWTLTTALRYNLP